MEKTTEIGRQRETAEMRAEAAWEALWRTIDEQRRNKNRSEAAREVAHAIEWYQSRAASAETWKWASEIEGREVHVYRRASHG